MTIEEISHLMSKAKELGLSSFTYQNLSFKFKRDPSSPQAPVRFEEVPINAFEKQFQPIPEKLAEELVKPLSVLDQMSEEEIRYYATPYYDELHAQKEAHAKKLAEEPQV